MTVTVSRTVASLPFLPKLVWRLLAHVYVNLKSDNSLVSSWMQLMERPACVIRQKKRKWFLTLRVLFRCYWGIFPWCILGRVSPASRVYLALPRSSKWRTLLLFRMVWSTWYRLTFRCSPNPFSPRIIGTMFLLLYKQIIWNYDYIFRKTTLGEKFVHLAQR